MRDAHTILAGVFDEHLEVARASRTTLLPSVETLAVTLIATFAAGGRLLVFGNGGSAADAQHFAGELAGHYKRDRRPLPALALTTDTSVLTATANDYAFEDVFARAVEAHCRPGDVVVGISTSGTARNVARGLLAAHGCGARTWALTGSVGGPVAEVADNALLVPSAETARVQEMHITVIHAVCELIDRWAAGEDDVGAEASEGSPARH